MAPNNGKIDRSRHEPQRRVHSIVIVLHHTEYTILMIMNFQAGPVSRAPRPPSTVLAHLDAQHLTPLDALICSTLTLDATEDAFAQIIDGVPTRDSFTRNTGSIPILPAVLDRDRPSEDAITTFRKFRAGFTSTGLTIASKAVQSYQNTPPSSNKFNLHLLEMAALAIHALAATLYTTTHPDINTCPTEPCFSSQYPHYGVDLYCRLYHNSLHYPYGIADMVGYWAETQVFGGVVLFEHEHKEADSELLNAFIHPPQQAGNSVFRLSPSQLTLLQPLPFTPPEGTITVQRNDLQSHYIFRDEFSRIYPPIMSNRPSCIRPLTDDLKAGYNWARQQNEARIRGEPYETRYCPSK
ncbi:hypothetical protein FQN53_008558 [Emmonsiellopsis sp. PD_33]|nr:hypothetical protein FQN53_008558 [Emmonsiellopsis sp. PD_33]